MPRKPRGQTWKKISARNFDAEPLDDASETWTVDEIMTPTESTTSIRCSDQLDAEPLDASETGTGDEIMTPTESTASTTREGAGARAATAVPWPGNKYKIRHRDSDRYITLVEGDLRLEEYEFDGQGGSHWVCVQKDNWFGFRSPVSGTFIGHDGNGEFIASVRHHKGYECFCPRMRPDGYYLLMSWHWKELHQMAVGGDGKSLVESKDKGAVWEFEEV